MRKLIFNLFIYLIIGLFFSASSYANPLEKLLKKGKEQFDNIKLTKKSITPFLNDNNFFIKRNGKILEYVFKKNGELIIYDDINKYTFGTWKFSGLIKNAVRTDTYIFKKEYLQFYKGFKKISVVKNLAKFKDDQTDYQIRNLSKPDSEKFRKKKITKINKEKKLKAEIERKKKEEKLKKKQELEKKQKKILAEKKQNEKYQKLKKDFGSLCVERFFGTVGYKEGTDDYRNCLKREAKNKELADRLYLENEKNREYNRKKILSEIQKNKENLKKITKLSKNQGYQANKNDKQLEKKPILLLLDLKIINQDKLGDLDIPGFLKTKKIEKLTDDELDDYKENHTQVTLIVKRDFLANSNPDGKEIVKSEYLAGNRTIPNPRYNQIINKVNQWRNYRADCQNRIYSLQSQANRDCSYACSNPYNVGGCYGCTGGKLAASISIGEMNSGIRKSNREISALNNELASTSPTLLEDIYRPYNYDLNKIKSIKKAVYDFYVIKDETINFSTIEIVESKKFKIPSNVSNKDKDKNVFNKYNSLENVKNWENKKMRSVKYTELFEIYKKNIKKTDENNLYASLNVERTGFFSSFFSKSKKTNNEFKRVSGSKIDKRFNNVVIIKTLKGSGSGFYIKPNQIITNYHVIDGAKNITIQNINGKASSAKILRVDTRRDLALLETNLRGKPVNLYKKEINPGMNVTAVGHPMGLDYTLTNGVVSSVRMYASTYNVTRNPNTKFIQTDVAINPGNSGGPLFHNYWVIGVNTQGLKKSKTEGLNFAVHVDELIDFLK